MTSISASAEINSQIVGFEHSSWYLFGQGICGTKVLSGNVAIGSARLNLDLVSLLLLLLLFNMFLKNKLQLHLLQPLLLLGSLL